MTWMTRTLDRLSFPVLLDLLSDTDLQWVIKAADRPKWTYDSKSHRYRDDRGRFIGPKQMADIRDAFIDRERERAIPLAERLVKGDITVNQWVLEMRDRIKTSFIDEYLLGRGGRRSMTQADWGRIGQMLRQQYRFLNGFASEIKAGNMTAGQIGTRAGMYFGAARSAYEVGRGIAMGDLRLPYYPADGNTVCLTNCHCRWDIVDKGTEWWCYYRLDAAAENCPDCQKRAADASPLVVQKSVVQRAWGLDPALDRLLALIEVMEAA